MILAMFGILVIPHGIKNGIQMQCANKGFLIENCGTPTNMKVPNVLISAFA